MIGNLGAEEGLSPNTVTVRGGQVVEAVVWVELDREFCDTIRVWRDGDSFRCITQEPGYNNGVSGPCETLEEALNKVGMNSEVQEHYLVMFSLVDITEAWEVEAIMDDVYKYAVVFAE